MITRIRQTAIQSLMPDTCTIYPQVSQRQPSGAYKDVSGTPITYNNSSLIPCRLDTARFFRSGDLEGQVITINDFELVLPFDVVVKSSYRVSHGNEVYEIRKMMDTSTNTITANYLVTRLNEASKPL